MKKILYAASERSIAKIQFNRFKSAIQSKIDCKEYTLKFAAYNYGQPNFSYDFNIGYLMELGLTKSHTINSDYIQDYYEFVKLYAPDIIVNDSDHITAHIANLLDIKYINASPINIRYGMKLPYIVAANFNFYTRQFRDETKNLKNKYIIENAAVNLINSPLADFGFELNKNFKWLRPYYLPLNNSDSANVAVFTNSNKNDLLKLIDLPVDIVYSPSYNEKYSHVSVERELNYNGCSVNSKYLISNGHSEYVSDALYNGKIPIIFPDLNQQNIR